MSINRMTQEEKAHYLIGRTIMRYIGQFDGDTDEGKAVDVVCRWLRSSLTDDEADTVMEGTGLILDERIVDQLSGPRQLHEPSTTDDSDVPF